MLHVVKGPAHDKITKAPRCVGGPFVVSITKHPY
jgi:hypothetical protein